VTLRGRAIHPHNLVYPHPPKLATSINYIGACYDCYISKGMNKKCQAKVKASPKSSPPPMIDKCNENEVPKEILEIQKLISPLKQPLLDYLFTNPNQLSCNIIYSVIQWVNRNLNPNETKVQSKFEQYFQKLHDQQYIDGMLFMLLLVIPEMTTLIELCKENDRAQRVDAFIRFTRRSRLELLGLQHTPDSVPIYNTSDFVYRCIMFYHCL
jgi:hypothetical protein